MDESDIPDRWSRAKELFQRAVELPPGERDDFIAHECARDPELLAEVTGLLRADAAPAGVLDHTLDVASLGLGAEGARAPLVEGTQIGAWRIVRPLGRGGMGIVYLAERADVTFAQRAALKIVRGGLASLALEERFLRERRILARLEHPGIARLLDGGLTGEGQPWFAMELVEGEPITDWAEKRGLDVDARLRLFIDVCEAVQYAHRQLVIHRDLKPANILIDGDGRAKLLDFGVARLLDDGADEAGLTRAGCHPLTPACAAPEQIRGERATTATDVFQLGAVLYELLCGKPIRETTATSLTGLARLLDQNIPSLASHRGLPRVLVRRLHGDLETIVACALAAEPERRYASVEALAADVERHLEARPVKARPASTAYHMSRYVRRHWIGVAAVAAVLLLLAAGTAGIAWQAIEARREAVRAREMAAFLQDLFDAVDPDEARGRVVTARELLDRGADRINELKTDTDLRVDMLRTLGTLYYRLGVFDRSESLLRQAEKGSLAAFGPDDVRTARVRAALGYTMTDAGRFAEAEPIIATAVATGRKSRNMEAILNGLEALAHLRYLQGRYQEACDVDHGLLPLVVEYHGPRSAELAGLKNSLGACSMYLDRYDEAERFYAEAVLLQREIHGNDHTAVADTLGLIAILRGRQGRYKDAEPILREALAIRERVLAPEHPDLAISYDSLARNLDHQGRREEARALHERALELQRRVLGLRHPDVAASLTNLSTLEYRMGNLDAALAHQLEAIAIYRETIGETRNLALAVGNAGVMLRDLGRYEEARRMLEESLAMRRRHSGEPDTAIAAARMHLATLDRLTGRLATAESQFRQALAIFESRLPDGHTRIAEARTGLGATLLLSKRASEALPLLERAHAALRSAESVDEVRLAECRLWLGAALARQSRRDEARDHLQQARTVLVNLRGPEHALSVQATAELAAIGP